MPAPTHDARSRRIAGWRWTRRWWRKGWARGWTLASVAALGEDGSVALFRRNSDRLTGVPA